MINLSTMIYIIILILSLFTINVFGEKESSPTIIKILTKLPDVIQVIDLEDWKNNYQWKMNEYFKKINESDADLKDVTLEFAYYDYGVVGNSSLGLQFNYLNDVISSISNGEYDMVIMDERSLFSELSFMESDWIEYYLLTRRPSIDNFVNFSEKKIETQFPLDFNDPKILKDARYQGDLYGLPYELDFDLLFYERENLKAKNLVETMEHHTWDTLVHEIFPDPLKISLGEDNNMLNFFVEYAYNHYNLTKAYDPDYFHAFYNDTAEGFYQSFYDLVSNYTNNDMYKTLMLSQDEALQSFLHGESIFFKGKASYSSLIQNISDKPIGSSLPPKHISAMTEKFLMVSKFSSIDQKILIKAAGQLTSKEMQLLRANEFGSIPTFDVFQKDKDPDLSSYCQTHEELCHYLETMHRVYVKDVFSLKYSSPFYEIIVLLVPIIKTYLREYNIPKMIFSFKNINELITFNLGLYGILAKIFIAIIAIISIIMIVLVYKHRNHPYLKLISPMFCIMILIGCTLNMVKIYQIFPPYSIVLAKMMFIISIIGTNLIYIPMISVTYRIYRIHSSNSILPSAFTNRNLIIGTFIAISVSVIYGFVVIFTQEFYYLPFGSLRSPRFPEWLYTKKEKLYLYYKTYLQFIFIFILFMIIATKDFSKNFGDVCYTFIIYVLNIVDFIIIRIMQKISHEHFSLYMLILFLINGLTYFGCEYFLVGSRLVFIILYPEAFDEDNDKVLNSNLTEFISTKSKGECLSTAQGTENDHRTFASSIYNNNNNNNNALVSCVSTIC